MTHLKLAPNESINIKIESGKIYVTYSRSLGKSKGSIVKRIEVPNFKTVVDLMREVQQRGTGVDVGNFFNGSVSDMGNTQKHDQKPLE